MVVMIHIQGISEFGRERGRNIWIRPHIFVKKFARALRARRTASATAAMSAARETDREVAREAHLEEPKKQRESRFVGISTP